MGKIPYYCLVLGVGLNIFPCYSLAQTKQHKMIFEDPFSAGLQHWVIESESDKSMVTASHKELEIIAPEGITIWLNQKLESKLKISYEAKVIGENGPYDRVSDLNCFWMATDPQHPDNFMARSAWRGGIFENYYSLHLYYAGYGGHDNTKTRFRKYDGNYEAYRTKKLQPQLLKELTDRAHLIKPNTWCRIEILVREGRTVYTFNEEVLFDFSDKTPYAEGYFGFRTVKNHVKIRNFKIVRIE